VEATKEFAQTSLWTGKEAICKRIK